MRKSLRRVFQSQRVKELCSEKTLRRPECRRVPLSRVRLIPERFPVKSRLHHGWKAAVYNGMFVSVFNAVPRALVRRFGWHLMAVCEK